MLKMQFVLGLLFYFVVSSHGADSACVDHHGCLSMNMFANTYNQIQSAIDNLNTQLKYLKTDLDSAINSTCGVDTYKSIETHTYNLTICDFEHGMCGYVPNHNYIWTLTRSTDHTYGTPKGHVARTHPSYTTSMISLPFDKASSYCIRFFYRTYSSSKSTGSLKVFIKVNNGVGTPVFTQTEFQPYWQLAEISPDSEFLTGKFQLVFEGIRGNLELDDIAVYNAPCSTEGIHRPKCGNGYEWQSGNEQSCVTFHIEPLTWYEATQRCKRDYPYAHLVSITTMDKQNYIMKKIESSPDLTQTAAFGYWTSGTDETSEGKWVWTGNGNPVPLNYTDWHVGQPNNVGGDQDCLLIQYYDDHYKWGDVGCTEKHPFICEANYQLSQSFFQPIVG